jgi:hypothetical protein
MKLIFHFVSVVLLGCGYHNQYVRDSKKAVVDVHVDN